MIVVGRVVTGTYQDSVRLMRIGETLRAMPGVNAVGVVMATPNNIESLTEAGLSVVEAGAASPEDILIAVSATSDDAAVAALDAGEDLVTKPAETPTNAVTVFPTVGAALRSAPETVIGFVSVPGEHAPREALPLIERGHQVVMFSDNVSIDDEHELKAAAAAAGTAFFGPDCGTAKLGAVGLGFVNETNPGPVGIVAASGTGAQAVAVALDRLDTGVSHIVGLGGRDLSDDIGGTALLGGLAALDDDSSTEVIVVIAKQIGEATMGRLLRILPRLETPIVTCLFGQPEAWITSLVGAVSVNSLGAAATAARELLDDPEGPAPVVDARVVTSNRRRLGERRALRGAFAGGTIAFEATQILRPLLGAVALSIEDAELHGHAVVDLGDDRYTRGQPHPMINPSHQADFIRDQLSDRSVGVVLFDVVLGHGSHDSPAEVLVKAVMDSRRRPDPFVAVATVVGSNRDPQDVLYQREILADAGIVVFEDTASAALFAGLIACEEPADVPVQVVDLAPAGAVINVGARWFADALAAQGVDVLHVDWHPPAQGDKALAEALEFLS